MRVSAWRYTLLKGTACVAPMTDTSRGAPARCAERGRRRCAAYLIGAAAISCINGHQSTGRQRPDCRPWPSAVEVGQPYKGIRAS